MRTVCVVSGSRAEFGLLRPLLEKLRAGTGTQLQLVLTGMHLTPQFGDSRTEIEASGFTPDAQVPMLLSGDTATCTTKSVGLGLIGFADAFARLSPDLVVVLGDRTEIFAAAQAAWIANLPLAHIHGGEVTVGAIDDGIRHAITKLSSLHFVATARARERVIQLGEQPERVFQVGSLGVESIHQLGLMSREQVEHALGVLLDDPLLLVTLHPETQAHTAAADPLPELLAALEATAHATVLFTASNCDTGGDRINRAFEQAVRKHSRRWLFRGSLGHQLYLSCMRASAAVIGNSSSGIIEAPALGVPTINIGVRQDGRERARSIIDVPARAGEIKSALDRVLTGKLGTFDPAEHPYAGEATSARIAEKLESYPLEDIQCKRFHDLAVSSARD